MGLSRALCVGSTMSIAVKQNHWRQNRGSWGTILCLVSSCPDAQVEADTALRARRQQRCGGSEAYGQALVVLVHGDDRRSDAAGMHMQAKMTPRRSFPRRLTPSGSTLAMLKQQCGETRAEPPRQCESIPYNRGRFTIIGDVQPTSRVEFWRK